MAWVWVKTPFPFNLPNFMQFRHYYPDGPLLAPPLWSCVVTSYALAAPGRHVLSVLHQHKWFFVFRDWGRLKINLRTKIRTGPKCKNQKCIFAFNKYERQSTSCMHTKKKKIPLLHIYIFYAQGAHHYHWHRRVYKHLLPCVLRVSLAASLNFCTKSEQWPIPFTYLLFQIPFQQTLYLFSISFKYYFFIHSLFFF